MLDPHIARKLRPHQIEGVQFMHSKAGMILADEMGLGKTLQIIALLWTLLKQGSNGRPDVEKCLVVCPSSLVSNWSKEVRKWLGNERLQALTVTQGNPDNSQIIRDFKTIRGNPSRFGLLILSYESARKYSSEIGPNACDLLICDEAHRLKSGEGKTIEALQSLEAKRKILLTGTPVQNNLEEFNALLEFVSPGLHCGPSSSSSFKKNYSDVISKGRDGCASDKERADADERSLELNKIISDIVLRRTSDILIKHLPPLTQLLVFVQPTRVQIDLYRKHLDESERGLSLIRVLQKISTSPALLKDSADDPKESSGKMKLVAVLLEHIIGSGQKCVLVSTSTATLDLIDRYLCIPMGHDTVRIDGSTNVNARQDIVDGFNLRNQGKVMLLSTRAGGAGLNLIGANNLILIDSDWNPAHDLQAMARIWRDGQIKPCFIYRLLTAGTIEEKVYQRQLKKGDLANATVDLKAGSVGLNNEDLRELFSIQPSDETEANGCDTMALLEKSEGSDAPIRWMSTEGGNSLTHHPVLSMAFRSGLVRAIGEVVKGGERVAINEAQSDEEEAVAEIQEVMVTMNEMKPVEKLPQAIDPVNQPLAMNPTLAGTGSRKRLRKMLEEIENESKVLDELEDL